MHLRAEAALMPDAGVALYQTRPDCVHIDDGAEHLACLRLSPKGLLRWYASCCDTPLANTLVDRPKHLNPSTGLHPIVVRHSNISIS